MVRAHCVPDFGFTVCSHFLSSMCSALIRSQVGSLVDAVSGRRRRGGAMFSVGDGGASHGCVVGVRGRVWWGIRRPPGGGVAAAERGRLCGFLGSDSALLAEVRRMNSDGKSARRCAVCIAGRFL